MTAAPVLTSPRKRGEDESPNGRPGEGGSPDEARPDAPPHPVRWRGLDLSPLAGRGYRPATRRHLLAWAGALALAPFALRPVFAEEGACRPLVHEGARYTICRADLRRAEIRLFWRRPGGEPYGSVRALGEAMRDQKLLFAMNAGMYHADLSPVGLYVEAGRELARANTAGGPGNFHLKPNGVFWVGRGRAGILETSRYLREKPPAEYATQSGPMLVIDGRLHPRISGEGPSRKRRNGVGIVGAGREGTEAVFAIAEEPVSFGAFARLFRDALGCRDALFLDGSISGLWAPGMTRLDALLPAGPVVGVMGR